MQKRIHPVPDHLAGIVEVEGQSGPEEGRNDGVSLAHTAEQKHYHCDHAEENHGSAVRLFVQQSEERHDDQSRQNQAPNEGGNRAAKAHTRSEACAPGRQG